MKMRLYYLLRQLKASIWLLPLLLCLVSAPIAALMLWLDTRLLVWYPTLATHAMTVESARSLLTVIVGAVISVGTVAFSVTMVALTLTSGQYGPKVIRHFLDDNGTKLSLGSFLGAFVYAMILLAAYRSEDAPQVSVLFALIYTLLVVVSFIHFIHNTAVDLQADEIIERLGRSLQDTLTRLVAETEAQRNWQTLRWRRKARGRSQFEIPSRQEGYVQAIDYEALLDLCAEHDLAIRISVRAGDFIIRGSALFKVFAADSLEVEQREIEVAMRNLVTTGRLRTAMQDPEYPMTQINQIAARALSPGINDPGTAVSCIDTLTLALSAIVEEEFGGCVFYDQDDEARLLARSVGKRELFSEAFATIRRLSGTNSTLWIRQFQALEQLARLHIDRGTRALIDILRKQMWDAVPLARIDRVESMRVFEAHNRLRLLLAS